MLETDSEHMDLAEVHVDVFSGLLVELRATNLLSEVSDAYRVAGVKLLDEKVTAGLDHAVYLIHDGAVHHVDHALFSYRDAGSVGELYEPLHYLSRRKWKQSEKTDFNTAYDKVFSKKLLIIKIKYFLL